MPMFGALLELCFASIEADVTNNFQDYFPDTVPMKSRWRIYVNELHESIKKSYNETNHNKTVSIIKEIYSIDRVNSWSPFGNSPVASAVTP